MPGQTMESRLSKLRGRNVHVERNDKRQFFGELQLGEDGGFTIQSGGRGRPAIVFPDEVTKVTAISQATLEEMRAEHQKEKGKPSGISQSELERATKPLLRLLAKLGVDPSTLVV